MTFTVYLDLPICLVVFSLQCINNFKRFKTHKGQVRNYSKNISVTYAFQKFNKRKDKKFTQT